jgi:hypothetical protein
MVETYPGSPWQYNISRGTDASTTGTVAFSGNTAATSMCYLTKLIVSFDASAVARWFLWASSTGNVMLGPFYPTTNDSWMFDFGPVGLRRTGTATTSINVGWVFSASGIFNCQMIGYSV